MTDIKELNDEELVKVSGGDGAGNDNWQGKISFSCSGLYYDGVNWVRGGDFSAGTRVRFTGQSMWFNDSEYVEVYVEGWDNPIYILESRISRY